MTKICSICGAEKDRSDFYSRHERNSVRSSCKKCDRITNHKWQVKNRERVNDGARKSYWRNPERSIEYSRKWRKENPGKRQVQHRREMTKAKLIPERWIKLKLRQRINKALRGNWKSGHTMELLSCPMWSFKIYLESLFEVGMSWDNYGSVWEIDHIIPCALFDLTNPDHQRRCFHFSNMQPMFVGLNRSKGKKYCANK